MWSIINFILVCKITFSDYIPTEASGLAILCILISYWVAAMMDVYNVCNIYKCD